MRHPAPLKATPAIHPAVAVIAAVIAVPTAHFRAEQGVVSGAGWGDSSEGWVVAAGWGGEDVGEGEGDGGEDVVCESHGFCFR